MGVSITGSQAPGIDYWQAEMLDSVTDPSADANYYWLKLDIFLKPRVHSCELVWIRGLPSTKEPFRF